MQDRSGGSRGKMLEDQQTGAASERMNRHVEMAMCVGGFMLAYILYNRSTNKRLSLVIILSTNSVFISRLPSSSETVHDVLVAASGIVAIANVPGYDKDSDCKIDPREAVVFSTGSYLPAVFCDAQE